MRTGGEFSAAGIALLAVGAPALAAGPATANRPDVTVVYKKIGAAELKLHVFRPRAWKPGDKRPCIVFFFGGGWNGGSPGQFYPHCRYFASRGMVAISAEYRVKSRHKTTPFECVKDAKSAIRWIRRNAKSLGVDPNRVAAGGGSAGRRGATSRRRPPFDVLRTAARLD